jgi:hypothetical protein
VALVGASKYSQGKVEAAPLIVAKPASGAGSSMEAQAATRESATKQAGAGLTPPESHFNHLTKLLMILRTCEAEADSRGPRG